MQKQLKSVEEFSESFQIHYANSPCILKYEEEYKLRHLLMEEENNEYLEACENKSLVDIADALGDQLYILCGTILKHGLQHKIEEVFEEIHRSNMSKLGDDSKPLVNGLNIFDENNPIGKILKSENYFKPDLEKVLNSNK